jgi:hypothetical protein
MIEQIPVMFSDGFVWRTAKPFYTNELSLIKPYLISLTDRTDGFINSVEYFVIDANTGAVWGTGKTKIEAINHCKRLYKNLSDKGVLIEQINKKTEIWNVAWAKYQEEDEKSVFEKVVSIKSKRQPLPKKLPKRALVFKKNNGKCFYCDDQLEIDAEWHIEHKQPKSKGGTNDIENLVPSCPSCNLKKRDKTAKEFLEAGANG